jgi:hypothetical protein
MTLKRFFTWVERGNPLYFAVKQKSSFYSFSTENLAALVLQ